MRLHSRLFERSSVAVGCLLALVFGSTPARAASFDPNRLLEDADFIQVNALQTDQVQRFLARQGSFLANYSENGRTAAQIIVDAAHGAGDASGPFNGITISPATGTVNPAVILVTLQKEQGLVTMATQNDNSLRAAMGYSCPDAGGCNPAYAGFTKQVENGAWQLRYNYEASGQSASWRDQYYRYDSFPRRPMVPGESLTVTNTGRPDQTVTMANRATAALYRYTPHVYNGNYSFWSLYTAWFNQLTVTTSALSLDTHGGILGTETHADLTLHYESEAAHTLDVAVIARRKDGQGQYSQNYDFGAAGPRLVADGADVRFAARRGLPAGEYLVYGAYAFNGEWYPLSDLTRSFSVRPPALGVSFGSTRDYAVSGQAASVQVTFTNTEAQRIYYAGFGLAARNASNQNFDFPVVANEYLDPGQSKTVTFSRPLPDGDYALFPIYKIDTPDWYPAPGSFRLGVWPDESYRLRFSSLAVSQQPPYFNDPVDVTFSVVNPTDHLITIPSLRLAGRRFGAGNYDFGAAQAVAVPAGATVPIHFQTVLGKSGSFQFWPIYLSGNGRDWRALKPASQAAPYVTSTVY